MVTETKTKVGEVPSVKSGKKIGRPKKTEVGAVSDNERMKHMAQLIIACSKELWK